MSSLDIAFTLSTNEAVHSAVMAGPFATVMSELVVASRLQAGLLAKANFGLPARTRAKHRWHSNGLSAPARHE